jgi:hypothetical protein
MPESVIASERVSAARSMNRVSTAYCQARVVHSAVELGLFPFLTGRSATAAEIVEGLGLHPRLTGDFLDSLVGLGFLERDDAAGGGYSNSAGAEEFLVPGSPLHLGGSMYSHATIHYHVWGKLTEALRDGHAKSGVIADASFQRSYKDPNHIRQFMDHMDGYTSFVGHALVNCVDWSSYESFVDFGGARGNIAMRLVKAHPHLRGGVFDLPEIKPLFDEHMEKHGTAGRITFHEGDFFESPLPATDVAVIGHVLHDWPPSARARLIGRLGEAVRLGGMLVIYDAMIDDARRDPESLLQSLRCRMMREGGSEYTAAECGAWVEAAGFEVRRLLPVDTLTDDRILTAVKVAT